MSISDDWPTFELDTGAGRPAIRCLLCSRISQNTGDVEHRYCGQCHLFHDAVADARRLYTAGAPHECDEWPTARGVCAVCGDALHDGRGISAVRPDR